VSRYQKGKTNLDFTEARDSEWQWHQLGQSVKALKEQSTTRNRQLKSVKTEKLKNKGKLKSNSHRLTAQFFITLYFLLCFDTVGWASEISACKNFSVMKCWCGYLSGARCRLFAYGPADATACHPKTP